MDVENNSKNVFSNNAYTKKIIQLFYAIFFGINVTMIFENAAIPSNTYETNYSALSLSDKNKWKFNLNYQKKIKEIKNLYKLREKNQI